MGDGNQRELRRKAGLHGTTVATNLAELRGPPNVRSFQLVVEEGPAAGTEWRSGGNRCAVGSHDSNELTLADPTVSRFHCEILVEPDGAKIRDLGSKNGTVLDGVSVVEAWLRGDSRIRLGRSLFRFQFGEGVHRLPVSEGEEFGPLVGVSLGMRTAFGVLERAAATDTTVLIEGETGTGKEGAALGLHRASSRERGPFVVVDCGSIPGNLLESELFGHERGAFTGASAERVGAFEEASGGTIFLDEIGELPVDLQPKLLRALEQRQVRRVGSNRYRPVDVRVVAATNRDLRTEVNSGDFRADLYYRLAVVRVRLPPLRQRPDDIPVLVDRILDSLTDENQLKAPLRERSFLSHLARNAWVGNVRELRNYLERCLVLGGPIPLGEQMAPPQSGAAEVDADLPYAEARRRAIDRFERGYLEELLRRQDGNVSQAARAAGMNRAYLYRLLSRHGIRSS